MSRHKSLKKTESIEVRIPFPTKTAFMSKARSEGRAASDIVRQHIDAYLGEDGSKTDEASRRRANGKARRYLAGFVLVVAASIGLAGFAGSAAPPRDEPALRAAFAALDTDGDGHVIRREFVAPQHAHEIDLRGARPGLAEPLAVGQPGTAAYMRYMLSTTDGDVPLLIAIDPPRGQPSAAQLANAIGKSFEKLDRDGDGALSVEEFLAP